MIIDSHAHYNNNAYKKPFRYLSYDKDGYALKEGDRDQLFQELQDSDIPYSIEPGVSLQSCEDWHKWEVNEVDARAVLKLLLEE